MPREYCTISNNKIYDENTACCMKVRWVTCKGFHTRDFDTYPLESHTTFLTSVSIFDYDSERSTRYVLQNLKPIFSFQRVPS